LPWGKGIGTLFFSQINFEPLGLSIHLINNTFDTGDVIFRKILYPKVTDTTRTFYLHSLYELNKYFKQCWPYIKTRNFKRHKQHLIGKKSKYFSRNDFEQLIMKLPCGYDTNMFDLSVVGLIMKNNYECKLSLKKLMERRYE